MNRSKYWNKCILEIDSFVEKYSPPYLEFSYETLCESPQPTLNKLSTFLELDPSNFSFDTSLIKNQNHKVAHLLSDPEWEDFLDIMKPAMEKKRYF